MMPRSTLLWVPVLLLLLPSLAWSHCQVPCGIYDDAARIQALLEDATTIEKAMTRLRRLTGSTDAQSDNQIVRWVMTKEDHASRVITVLSEYFLTQKLTPVAEGEDGYEAYLQKLADHHAVLHAAMKCKQSVDTSRATELRDAIQKLAQHYELEEAGH